MLVTTPEAIANSEWESNQVGAEDNTARCWVTRTLATKEGWCETE